LPESILQNAETVDSNVWAERLIRGRREQLAWLDVQLELHQQSVAYGAPAAFRLTITNVQKHPVIFVRPVYATFLGASTFISPYPFHLFWDIVSSSGERLDPYGETVLPQMYFPPRTAEMFAVLPVGESCTVEAQVDWGQMPLDEPLPPGTYRVRVVLRGSDLGPQTESYEHLDIGAWVGSNGSNPVTMTVQPRSEDPTPFTP
jgi:hypothetical protein